MIKIDRAFVLAAGFGTRMQPLSRHRPKPLVELDRKMLIDHVIDRLGDAGVMTVAVNVHHLADQIETHLAGRSYPEIQICDERNLLLDTGGGARNALGVLGYVPFITANSDSIWVEGASSAIERLISAFDPERMDCLLLLASVVNSVGYDGTGDFSMSDAGLLTRRGERPAVPFAYTGVSIAHPRLFEYSPKGPFSMNVLWSHALEA
jgi:MurNAc alpha-1-phosphate uridylyltransferase